MSFPKLCSNRTQLVKISKAYIHDLYEIFSEDQVTEFMDIESMKSLEEAQKEWVDWSHDIYKRGYGIRWGILYEGHIIGTCGFHNTRQINGATVADIGYDLGVPYWGYGFISEVIPVVVNYGFDVMRLDEIHACIYPENIRSIRSITKLGFEYVGIKRLEALSKGRFSEEAVYRLVRSTEKGLES